MRDALLDTTAELVQEHGLASVTTTQIAEATGIGRATLYKYFPDVESIPQAWHERRIGGLAIDDGPLCILAGTTTSEGTGP
ncbi:TetR/AcrR family transcriptional regulator [Nocardia xishanensis]|uniref:TetR/AcrR family transcriptional regulator n=1 Tax=Nocardia xishanensis TaxID=238964 RepID=A0ABW7X7E2_9NOCA